MLVPRCSLMFFSNRSKPILIQLITRKSKNVASTTTARLNTNTTIGRLKNLAIHSPALCVNPWISSIGLTNCHAAHNPIKKKSSRFMLANQAFKRMESDCPNQPANFSFRVVRSSNLYISRVFMRPSTQPNITARKAKPNRT